MRVPRAREETDFWGGDGRIGCGYNVAMKDAAESVARAFVRAINRQDVDALAARPGAPSFGDPAAPTA
jgi:hypothetical protein